MDLTNWLEMTVAVKTLKIGLQQQPRTRTNNVNNDQTVLVEAAEEGRGGEDDPEEVGSATPNPKG